MQQYKDLLFTALMAVVLFGIATLLALSTDQPGQVDPPGFQKPPSWDEIPTCSNGGRTDCGSTGF